MSTLNEVEEENVNAKYDDQMPQIFSQASTNHQNKQDDEITSINSSTPNRPSGPLLEETNHYDEEEDDVVTPKTPKMSASQGGTSQESTSAEDIGSDDETETTEDASPQ